MKLAALLMVLALWLGHPAQAADVGFQSLTIPNGSDTPLKIGVWYPTDAAPTPQPLGGYTQSVASDAAVAGERLPLVVMSHGTGGWFGEHYDTALALAQAGFVVAAVSHTGDTYDDESRATRIAERPAQLRRLADYMLAEWPSHARIDPDRIGVFGFSAGAFTALVEIGGRPDLGEVRRHCAAVHKGAFECNLISRAPSGPAPATPPRSSYRRDPRIKAAVIAAPALGYTFGREGLQDVTVPVQLWKAAEDSFLPAPDYADAVRADLPQPPEFHEVAGADHVDFLAPCTATLAKSAPDICKERAGFGRASFHQTFNAEIVRFFGQTLR